MFLLVALLIVCVALLIVCVASLIVLVASLIVFVASLIVRFTLVPPQYGGGWWALVISCDLLCVFQP